MRHGEGSPPLTWPSPHRPGRSRRRDVYGTLRLYALSYRFRPGQHLAVVDLSDELRVSNTPVREALIRLHAEGLVSAVPARGFFARELQLQEMAELHDFARLILTSCIRAPRLEQRSQQELAASPPVGHTRPLNLTPNEQVEACFVELARRGGNEVVRRAITDLCERTRHIRLWAFQTDPWAGAAQTNLASLVSALAGNDGDTIAAALNDHFDLLDAALPDLVMRALAASFSANRETGGAGGRSL